MLRHILIAFLLCVGASPALAWTSTSCPAGKYDMLAWVVPGPLSGPPGGWYSSVNHQETQVGHPGYHQAVWSTLTNMGNAPGTLFQIKQSIGFPWDILKYDGTNISFYETGFSPTDQTALAIFTPAVPALRRCATAGFPGDVIRTTGQVSRTTYGGGNCALKPAYTDNIEMSLWGPYNLKAGDARVAGTEPTLTLSYRYGCNSSYSVCQRKEEFYYQKDRGWMWWTEWKWNGSSYTKTLETGLGVKVAGSTPAYTNSCGY